MSLERTITITGDVICNWQLINQHWFDWTMASLPVNGLFQRSQHTLGTQLYQTVSSYTVWHVHNIVLFSCWCIVCILIVWLHTFSGLLRYLLSEENSVMPREKLEVTDDMMQPLTSYTFIVAAHGLIDCMHTLHNNAYTSFILTYIWAVSHTFNCQNLAKSCQLIGKYMQ